MENRAFEKDPEKGNMAANTHDSPEQDIPVTSHQCKPEICRQIHAQYLDNKSKMAAGPWDQLKSVFLITIIGLMVAWLVLYVGFSCLGLL